jgi:hypothetical protein
MPFEELTADLRLIAEGIVDEAQVTRGAKWIEQLAVEYPVAHGLLISALYKEPKDVVSFLCVIIPELRPHRKNKHVLRFIKSLQTELHRGRKL